MSNSIKVNYYDTFRCSVGDCLFSCCQEWAIEVDENILDKWKDVKLSTIGLGDERQPELTLCDCLEKEGLEHSISLEEDKKCPFLSDKKLCKLVVELGEDYLTEICQRFPRCINTFEDRVEYSLDFGCPVVVDLLNENSQDIQFVEVGEINDKPSLLYLVREMILDMMKYEGYSLTERIMVNFYCLLDLLEQEDLTEEVLGSYKSEEYLESLVSEMRKLECDVMDSFWERNELFLDIAQVYRKGESYVDYLEDISMWAEKLEEYYSDTQILEKNQVFEAEYIRYEKLLKNYLVAEIWAGCLRADMELEDMVMVFQWVILEYAAIKQAIFLKWLSQEEKAIEYSMVRDYMMIVSRMAGYDPSDIKNCLEYSFDSTILEWGDLALILGNSKI